MDPVDAAVAVPARDHELKYPRATYDSSHSTHWKRTLVNRAAIDLHVAPSHLLKMNGVVWDQALETIVEMKGFRIEQRGNILVVR